PMPGVHQTVDTIRDSRPSLLLCTVLLMSLMYHLHVGQKFMTKIFILLLSLTSLSILQATDITKLVQETQKVSQSPKQLSFVWWIPQEFWETSFEQNPIMPKEERDEFLKLLKEYTIFAVVQSDIGTFGSFTHKDKNEIRKNIKLETNGEEIE